MNIQNAREIELTQGYKALVDAEDYERISQFKWYYNQGYAIRNLKGEL